MPTALYPQAKFDPIPPNLDLHDLVEQTPNFRWAQRVSRNQIRSLGPQGFEKLVLVHVIAGGKPLVIDGWNTALPKGLFSADWLERTYDKKQENVRDITSASDIPMTTGHYLRSMKQLTNQWSPNNFRDERRQRLYLKDIDCPPEWRDMLQKIMHPNLFYMNENVTSNGEKQQDGDYFRDEDSLAPAGDLMSSLPPEMRAQNLMCYIGHEGTYTPAHREMCASLGQNIMVEASGNLDGEKPGSSVWFMTESKDREVVREYFLSMLGHDIEIEKHFAQINAWKKATFDVYVVEQKPGDFILIPPLAAHQVWNRGTRTMKVAWNRTTVETLELALHEALPKARLVCRDEQYKNKAIIYYTLKKYYDELSTLEKNAEMAQLDFIGLGHDIVRSSPRAKQLASDFKKLFGLFTEIMVDETFGQKEKDVELIPFDSCVTCSYCRSNIFNRFLTCKHCVRPLINGDEDQYDICMECYAMGRSCACLSKLQWCEQWQWSELIDSYETWRSMTIKNDGFIDFENSAQPLEIARHRSGKKTLAQICQEALKRRPFKDIMKQERELTPSDSEADNGAGKKKKRSRKKKKGEVARCHVCCHKDYSYRVQRCTNPGCSEGYCYGVLYRAFDMMPQDVLEDEQWQCPKCMGICNCGYCRRTGNTDAYTPKNTSLGHDTRPIADDRSVEALVDFRIHNLSWLKAAGEEGRSKDSKRMKRLQNLADTAKSQSLTEEAEASLEAEEDVDDTQDQDQQQNSANDTTAGAPTEANDTAEDQDVQLLGEQDNSAYPDPTLIAHQHIGQLYYNQDNVSSQDRILFDHFQAPTAEALRQAEEVEVPEFVKKSIRAAKRKAKRENEDPEYRSRIRHAKKQKPNKDGDMLDNMDPALFGGEPSTLDDQVDDSHTGNGLQNAQQAPEPDEQPAAPEQPRGSWFLANEPLLRHAKPITSYVEMDEGDMDDFAEEEREPTKPPRPSGQKTPPPGEEHKAFDMAADAVRAMLGLQNVGGSSETTRAASTERPNGRATSAAEAEQANQHTSPRRRGRPPKIRTQPMPSEITVAVDTLEKSAETPEPAMDEEGRLISDVQIAKPHRRGRRSRAQILQDQGITVEAEASDTEEPDEPRVVGFDAEMGRFLREEEGEEGTRKKRSRRSNVGVSMPEAFDDDEGDLPDEDDEEERPKRRGRPRGRVSSTRGRPPGRPTGRPRGRPRKSEASDGTPDTIRATASARRSVSPEARPNDTPLLSMAERMARRGKGFKIGSRRGRGGTAAAPDRGSQRPQANSDDSGSVFGGTDNEAEPEVGSPEGTSDEDDIPARVPPKAQGRRVESPKRAPVRQTRGSAEVRLADVEDEDGYMSVSVSISEDDSDAHEAITARMSRGGRRGRGSGRGRGGGTPRGRPRGRPRGS